ncbi:MAG: pimeloyl-ACP methyl ester esterase BioH [Candidatus Thiodiazotropha taylori]|nr:pimeloyl-ACP methyl ester esterase BioH [Candidatus Thiodiazotropha taylori]MCW4314184.1 pimeloyl-ACP methyl ester esterase BioH [Candidatus Thiodiazotropha taylori]
MKLSVETLGQGRELVMLHGWGMNSSVWYDFAQLLARHYRVTLIDLPGHGHSPYAGQERLWSWAESCLEVAPQQAIWLGWSLGSMVTLEAVLQAPERINGVLVIAGMPRFVSAEDWPHAMKLKTLEQFIELLGDDMSRALERFLALQMLGSDMAVEVIRGLKSRLQERPDPDPEALQAGLELLKHCDLRERLNRITCPTSWIYGGRDTLAPSGASESLRQWLPEATTHTITRAAHTPFLSHPLETEKLLLESLEAMV